MGFGGFVPKAGASCMHSFSNAMFNIEHTTQRTHALACSHIRGITFVICVQGAGVQGWANALAPPHQPGKALLFEDRWMYVGILDRLSGKAGDLHSPSASPLQIIFVIFRLIYGCP